MGGRAYCVIHNAMQAYAARVARPEKQKPLSIATQGLRILFLRVADQLKAKAPAHFCTGALGQQVPDSKLGGMESVFSPQNVQVAIAHPQM